VERVEGLHRSTPAELKARLDAERRGEPFLVVRDGAGSEHVMELDPERSPVTIGRQSASDVALEWDEQVSRTHADLERIGDVWTLVDDGRSRNGSFVNGERVHGRRPLRHGDVLAIGRSRLVFMAPAEPLDGSTAAAARPAAVELSPAQRRVLVELCRPFAESRFAAPPSNRELATALFLSVETVRFHLHALFEAFALDALPQHRKRVVLARRALEEGIVGPSDMHAEG
jgi:pSer/pThr/pTyr-binding forkhead associated (FHA) protein